MERYWVYINSKVQGPVEVPALRKVPGFTLLTQVCAEGEQAWRMADDVIEIKSYFLAPPRVSALVAEEGNTLTIQEPPPVESPSLEIIEPESKIPAAGPPSLRQVCSVCAYKNPRDVSDCMKCGTPLPKGAPVAEAAASTIETPRIDPLAKGIADLPLPGPASDAKPVTPAPDGAYAVSDVSPKGSPMIEVPVTRILTIIAAASLLGGVGFGGYKMWVKHVQAKAALLRPRTIVPVQNPVVPQKIRKSPSRRRTGYRKVRHVSSEEAVALPGVASEPSHSSARRRSAPEDSQAERSPASYSVVPEAAPLRHRNPAPVDSPYAVKRRANQGLWEGQEEQAIKQVQHYRIYGGQRTIDRNVEILMQILRDREYNTAFESGKRIYLYNDLDWAAGAVDGPVYEVRLTFSGGKEQDGTARKPLRFAFQTDLERGTVEPGGNDQIHANTMHAYFDESRIPPEDRRAIAKDTEELVLAAQPDASPLALDTIARHFAETYTSAALSRVAAAYGLTLVEKKLAHEPTVVNAADYQEKAAAPVDTTPPVRPVTTAPAAAKAKPNPFFQGASVQYRMENGAGRERSLIVQVPSKASVARLWETLTGYDNLKQFVPDILVSEREGQDGAAVIVHTVSLTRLFFFVFKVNMHLRIIEHPQQHSLDFERIAGEFEQFRGSVELPSEAGSTSLVFHATVVPKGHMPDWVLRDMTQHFLVPVLDAIRAQAEAK